MNVAIWVAIIGGAFSLITILFNKRIEKRSSNIAVLAEIQRLLHVLDSHRGWFNSCTEDEKLTLPLVPFDTPIFDAQVGHVGVIDTKIVAKVVSFYSYVTFINSLQKMRDQYPASKHLLGEDAKNAKQGFGSHYAHSLDNVLNQYMGAFNDEMEKSGIPPLSTADKG